MLISAILATALTAASLPATADSTVSPVVNHDRTAGVSPDAARADANYMRLLKRLYDAGVTLVPGTDTFGSTSLVTEPELYERVGIPAETVLQMATIVSARVMKDESHYGSVAAGKVANLFIVNGQPAERVRDVRNVELVVRGGRVNAATLRRAVGGRGN